MDFLDPRRRRSHRRRLYIGYVLMSIVVAIGTLIVLYLAYGYDIDRKGGGLIQNGIVFVDSQPPSSTIYVNDQKQGHRTAARMVLPAGIYTIKLEAEGYRSWERTFSLDGGQIQRIVYPFLVPNILSISDVQDYASLPTLASQSPDRRWLLLQRPGQVYQFDLFDLNDPERAPEEITVPLSILTDPAADAGLTFIEWSNNNRHVLLERQYEGKTEFIIFDRDNPDDSVNINTSLGITPLTVSLKDKRFDQIFYLDAIPGTIRSADLSDRTISAPLAQGAIAYKSYGEDVILYATQEDVETGKTELRILERDQTYILRTVKEADAYVLDVSRYENRWYYVAGSASDNMAFVYKNPLASLKATKKTPLAVEAILRLDNPRFVSFSANSQYIALQSGPNFVTLDLEDGQQYRTKLDHDISISQKLRWMDGHRLLYVVNTQSYIIDFDGSNEETLVTMQAPLEPFFDKNYDNIFTLEPSKEDASRYALTLTRLLLKQ